MDWFARELLPRATKLARDLGTGADGRTWAIGRVMGAAFALAAAPFPALIAVWVAYRGPAPTLDQWGAFLAPAAAYEAAVLAAATALIRITHATEPPRDGA